MSLLQTSNATPNGEQNSTDEPEWLKAAIPVYILLIAIFGIVLNVFILTVFCFHKKACTVAEIYLSNLAAADLFLVACLPFWAAYVIKDYDWPFNGPMCKLVSLSITMNTFCSIYFLVLISIDRSVALVHPLSCTGMRRPKFAKLGCLLVWVFGLLLSIPMLIYRKLVDYGNNTLCAFELPTCTAYLLHEGIISLFIFIIPIFIISFCTYKIIRGLNARLNSQKTEQKATTLVLAVLIAFLICWLPFHLVRTVEFVEVLKQLDVQTAVGTYRMIFLYLGFFNSVLNPVLYVIVGKNFREKAKELFGQWSPVTLSVDYTSSEVLRSMNTQDVSNSST
ncbi:B2 bradykinin receptor-like [Labrus mixtus]|uniref:B2 bradykinin receptor-like n=1 Tax=Labrus mixtus TaxID=508554 RepID=UPI0029C04E68|nr:B2 bradykinin receptor-like [Labrus mixtus]XP_060918493.1 B2 bradykinin receptor-like [Labrus mixtus]